MDEADAMVARMVGEKGAHKTCISIPWDGISVG
jgi:hypothetical protein